MIDKFSEIPNEIKQILWMFLVAFIGGVIGYATKTHKTLIGKSRLHKLYVLFISILSSMFLAYITFELIYSSINNARLAVALSGIAAYTGTDLLVVIQERLIEKVKNKIDNI